MKRIYRFAIAAMMCSAAVVACNKNGTDPDNGGEEQEDVINPFSPKDAMFTKAEDSAQLEGGSANGKWVAGTNFTEFAACVWDVENNKLITYSSALGGILHSVNNDGVAVGEYDNQAAMIKDGNLVSLFYEKGEEIETEWGPVSTGDAGSSAYAISEDSGIIAGFYFDSAYQTRACIWTSPQTRVDLPLPSDEETGFAVSGAEARYISADGSVIGGWLIDDMGTQPFVIWLRGTDGKYTCKPVCNAFFDPEGKNNMPYMAFQSCCLSADGNWAGLVVAPPYDFENWESPDYQTARLNLATGDIEIMDGDAIEPFSISNDGTLVGCPTDFMAERKSYVWHAGEKTSVDLSSLISSSTLNALINVSAGYIAPDNSYVAGWANDSDYNYVSFIVK